MFFYMFFVTLTCFPRLAFSIFPFSHLSDKRRGRRTEFGRRCCNTAMCYCGNRTIYVSIQCISLYYMKIVHNTLSARSWEILIKPLVRQTPLAWGGVSNRVCAKQCSTTDCNVFYKMQFVAIKSE